MRDFYDLHPLLASAFSNAIDDWRTGCLGYGQIKVQCISNLQAAGASANGPTRRLISWCQALLETERCPYPRGLSPYTVRLRLLGILIGLFDGKLPKSSGEISRRNILLNARNAISAEKCLTRAAIIRQSALDFVNFECERNPLDVDPDEEDRAEENSDENEELEFLEQELDNLSDSERRALVSANIISGVEYVKIIKKSYELDNGEEVALIIMLGFRTGMRLREILGLETCDIIQHGGRLELHLQSNRRRQLKTFQSRRILDLNLLLSPNERKALLQWLEPRKARAEKRRSPVLLFGGLDAMAMPNEREYDVLILKTLSHARRERTLNSRISDIVSAAICC